MHNTAIYKAGSKIFPENYDLDHYFSVLFSFPENEWIAPNNKENEAYSICEQLGAVHLIAMKRIPVWDNSSFKGFKTFIRYNKDLQYQSHDKPSNEQVRHIIETVAERALTLTSDYGEAGNFKK